MAIRHAIQKEVFSPLDERLVGIVNVTKPGKKKKASFLCLSVNLQDTPPQVYISRVKSSEKKITDRPERESYRKVKGQSWHLSELRLVDGKSLDTEVPEFDLHFDKTTFKWIASSVAEKKAFIICLYKSVHKYLERKKPGFAHVDEEKLQELLHSVDPKSRVGGAEDVEEVQQEEYQELTPQEEQDLEALLSRENAIQDAAAFTEHLSEELAQLDEANIHALMGSETQIRDLMSHIDQALYEIEQMESKLSVYDSLLSGARGTIQKMSHQYSRILTENKNLKALCVEVQDLVCKLDLDPQVEPILLHSPLTGASNIRDCTNACATLQEAVNQELSQGVSILQAVTEQKQSFSTLSFSFGRRLYTHLSQMFVQQSTKMLEDVQMRHSTSPTISSHSSVHGDLLPYSSLMKWMRDCENQRFTEVTEAYVHNFQHVYEDEIKFFMADMKAMIARGIEVKKGGFLGRVGSNADIQMSLGSRAPLGGSLMVLSPSSRAGRGYSASVADFGASGAFGSPEHTNRPKFEQVFSAILEQLQPLCVTEQKFCTCFFHFAKPDKEDQEDQEEEEEDEQEEIDGPRRPLLMQVGELSREGGLQGMLGKLFLVLLPEIESFVTFGERLDPYNALYLLISVSQRLMFTQESGDVSYLDETLKRALVCIKRQFDKFIAAKRRTIEDMKLPRGGKCGILPCVTMFNEFALRAEAIVMATERRGELDKAYLSLIDAVFKTIERAAREHPKTPPGVIKYENYKVVVDILSRLKIGCLEMSRDEAKKKSRTYKREYVINCLGRPLEKLSLFFEGIESLIASGTKAEEVGFRLDYSRNELKKCIKEYPGREVKRGLEKLYRRVEKDVSEEVLEVIWGSMQEAFMEQFHHFQELINQCYPGSNITLEFTMEDLIEYFTSITQLR